MGSRESYQAWPGRCRCFPSTDADGDRGQYTGQVDSSSVPNGTGTMEYDDGPVVEGVWKDGILEADSSEEGDAATAGDKFQASNKSTCFTARGYSHSLAATAWLSPATARLVPRPFTLSARGRLWAVRTLFEPTSSV